MSSDPVRTSSEQFHTEKKSKRSYNMYDEQTFSSSLFLLTDIILFVSQQHLKPGSSWNRLLKCFSISMQKREIYVSKVHILRKNYFTHFHMQLYSCGNTPFTVCLKYLSDIIPVITTGYVDCFSNSRSLLGGSPETGCKEPAASQVYLALGPPHRETLDQQGNYVRSGRREKKVSCISHRLHKTWKDCL